MVFRIWGGSGEGANRWSTGDSKGNGTIPCHTVIMDTWYYVFGKTIKLYNTKSESRCKLCMWVYNSVQVVAKYHTHAQDINNRGIWGGGEGVYGSPVYFLHSPASGSKFPEWSRMTRMGESFEQGSSGHKPPIPGRPSGSRQQGESGTVFHSAKGRALNILVLDLETTNHQVPTTKPLPTSLSFPSCYHPHSHFAFQG